MTPGSSPYLIYGANGYTGALVARMAVARGQRPILAGRNEVELERLGKELGLEHRAFALDEAAAVDRGLAGVPVVLHCAGPFSRTSRPMAEGCLRRRVHYLDVTGETEVLEALHGRDAEARAAGVMLLPGAGFDVVPSDCLAVHLKSRLPGATRLTLAFQSLGRLSRGTATTMVENLHRGGLVRLDGVLTRVPAAWKTRVIDLGRGPGRAVTIPWGDVATAFHSTGIPNIEVYMAAPAALRTLLRGTRVLGPVLASRPAQAFLKGRIRSSAPGPTDEERARGRSFLWGEVVDASGRQAVSRLQTPEGYTLTALASLRIVERVLEGEAPVGFQTPAKAYGPDLVLGLEGVTRLDE
jgi:short subunit dehydrogenase-like uncharacterized protein